jgi:hypothetical protein
MTMDVLAIVKAVVARCANPCDTDGSELRRVLEQLAEAGFDVSDRFNARYSEYEVRPGFNMHHEREVEKLRWLRSLNLAIAPEFIALLPLAQAQSVLVRRYWSCAGETVRYVAQTPMLLRAECIDAAVADLRTLEAHGCVHPHARVFEGWLYGTTSGKLVLANWLSLRRSDADDEGRLESAEAMLRRRAGIV